MPPVFVSELPEDDPVSELFEFELELESDVFVLEDPGVEVGMIVACVGDGVVLELTVLLFPLFETFTDVFAFPVTIVELPFELPDTLLFPVEAFAVMELLISILPPCFTVVLLSCLTSMELEELAPLFFIFISSALTVRTKVRNTIVINRKRLFICLFWSSRMFIEADWI